MEKISLRNLIQIQEKIENLYFQTEKYLTGFKVPNEEFFSDMIFKSIDSEVLTKTTSKRVVIAKSIIIAAIIFVSTNKVFCARNEQLILRCSQQPNYGITTDIIEKKADAGNPYYQGIAAEVYRKGFCVVKNNEKAFYWAQRSASNGHPIGIYISGIYFIQGRSVDMDFEKGFGLVKSSIPEIKGLAEKNDSFAQQLLAEMYYNGLGFEKDIQTALFWYDKSAKLGHLGAQYQLGWMYRNHPLVNKNYQKSLYWYQKSAESGFAPAQFNLGVIYQSGKGVKQNLQRAIYWYKKAAIQGVNEAYNNLGMIYKMLPGALNEKANNYRISIKWFMKGASLGCLSCQNNLAIMYLNGLGTEKNITKAIETFEKAGNAGYPPALRNLAMVYRQGIGVKKDIKMADFWAAKAVEIKNHP